MLPVSAQPLGRGAGVGDRHGSSYCGEEGPTARDCRETTEPAHRLFLTALMPCAAKSSAGSFVLEDKAQQGASCAGGTREVQCGYLLEHQAARRGPWQAQPGPLRVSLFLCSGETELRSFSRIFIAELQRGFFEKHVWLSMWDRPPRSRFTRVQRATCCSLLIFLFLCANAVWYGVVGNVHLRCAASLGALASPLLPQGPSCISHSTGQDRA